MVWWVAGVESAAADKPPVVSAPYEARSVTQECVSARENQHRYVLKRQQIARPAFLPTSGHGASEN